MILETENIELKSVFTEEIYKEVIAFANTEGGFVYVGIDNGGNAVGLSDVDGEYTRITNGIRDAIMPDVTMFVHYTIQDNNVVRIAVNEGTNKPYYLRSKGLKPSGVYVRQGTSSTQASPDKIRKMIKESDGDNYEDTRSLEQELTFEAAKTAFDRYGVEFGAEKYLGLGMMRNEVYTNLALLMSDQCVHTTKIAVFDDETCTSFRDSRELGGSVFKQFEDAVDYLRLCNKTKSTIKGVIRTDKPDYPEEAIREALLNALVHRDYGFSGSIIINVNENKMEFISIGGLLPGLSAEDIRIGISQPRNKKLAEVFHRLHLIESYGTGIRRIYKLYENCPAQPMIDVTANAFRLVLPNMNEASAEFLDDSVTDQMKKVLAYIGTYGQITDDGIMQLLDVKRTRAYNLTKEMCEMKLIRAEGRGKTRKYYAI
ncbi:MAG: putative DNA binding domain-containing protein [Firmicutes bacterium]|nr:putative DNA binding domain-containing protein [Candidatus Colimorpha enterica]